MEICLQAFLFSLILSIDSFTGALALGFRPFTRQEAMRFAILSGSAEGICTVIGFFFGSRFVQRIAAYDHWVAFSVLFLVGLRMIYGALKSISSGSSGEEAEKQSQPLYKIILISLVTSIDAFGIGLALGVSERPIGVYAPMIAGGAFLSTLLGLRLAKSLSSRFGSRCEALGGLTLIVLSFQMLKI